MRAKAIFFTAPNRIEIGEVRVPHPADNEVRVDVDYSGVSPGTERWVLTNQFHDGVYTDPYKYPLVPGYQHAGTVLEAGRNVFGFEAGDRVFAPLNRFEGAHAKWGGHCSVSVNAAERVHHLPDNVSRRDAAMLVLPQVGYNGASRPPVRPGDLAVVIGDGLIGQFAAQVLRLRGAYVVVAGKGDRKRLSYAEQFSCDRAVDTAEEDLAEVVNGLDPDGARIVIEAIGLQENNALAYDLLAYNGHYVLNGFYPDGNPVELNQFLLKEITLYNPTDFRRDRMETTLQLVARGKIDIGSLVTHVVPFAEGPRAYEDLVLNRREFSLGIVIDWKKA